MDIATASIGSVQAVQWAGAQSVEWLRLVPREITSEWVSRAALIEEESGFPMSGEFHLNAREYIVSMRGRAEPEEVCGGRAAEWVILTTSEMRSVTIGCDQHSVPSFSWLAEDGMEIDDIDFSSAGRICSFKQKSLTFPH
jgi:hypothetical protein